MSFYNMNYTSKKNYCLCRNFSQPNIIKNFIKKKSPSILLGLLNIKINLTPY